MIAGGVPASENELLAQMPASYVAGALPRDLIPSTEKVWFETRAGLLALYWGRLTFLTLYLLLWVAVGVSSPPAAPGSAIFAAPGVLWLVVIVLQWRHQVYALTDQRAIRISGMRGSSFEDVGYLQVHRVVSIPGGVEFDTTPPATAELSRIGTRGRVLRWDGVGEAPRVYTYAEQAVAYGQRRLQVAAITQKRLDQIETTTFPCPYCGSLIDLAKIEPENPRCPVCTAPIAVPGLER